MARENKFGESPCEIKSNFARNVLKSPVDMLIWGCVNQILDNGFVRIDFGAQI